MANNDASNGCLTLSCREVEQLLDSYIDREVTLEQKASFDAHLSTCEACRELVFETTQIVEMARSLGDVPLGPDARWKLRQALSDRLGVDFGTLKPPLHVVKRR